MRYQGGKTKQSTYIVPIIEKFLKKNLKLNGECEYVEPFVGGGNIFTKVNWGVKICNDTDSDIINLWKYLANGGEIPSPQDLTLELYNTLREQDKSGKRKHDAWLYALVSRICSYGGKKWGGYAHINPQRGEDHISEAISSLKKQISTETFLSDRVHLSFNNCEYDNLEIKDGSVVYCDPPYEGTLGYNTDFNHEKFWEWCRQLSKRGCVVLISEYKAPSDFRCIWRCKKPDGMGTTKRGKKQKIKIEKLFIYNGK